MIIFSIITSIINYYYLLIVNRGVEIKPYSNVGNF